MARTLIYQQTHIRHPSQGKLFAVSHALARKLNPDCDFLVVDNASPLPAWSWCDAARERWHTHPLFPMSEEVIPITDRNTLVRFHESIGHFFHGRTDGGKALDGPGRAHSLALNMAMQAGYDRAAYIEADALFRRPVSWAFDRMTKPVGCQPKCRYYELDWHVVFFKDLAWLREFDFVGKYDWKNRVGEPGGEPAGEVIWQRILGEHVEGLPLVGDRGDAVGLCTGNIDQLYPGGVDVLTHVDAATYQFWLVQQGHADLSAGIL